MEDSEALEDAVGQEVREGSEVFEGRAVPVSLEDGVARAESEG